MLVVLPPSETKVSGGDPNQRLDFAHLGFPSQNPVRASLVDQVISLSRDPEMAMAVLKLGPQGAGEVVRNTELRHSGVLPAISRYTGVLYDALGYQTLEPAAQSHLHQHVGIFSALFGLVRSTDPLPAYRLSFDSALPQGKPGKQWAATSEALWAEVSSFVIDLRSEGYRGLAPLPPGKGIFVQLVQPGPRGARKALGHANKAFKGTLVRNLMLSRAEISSSSELVEWGKTSGYYFDEESVVGDRIDLVFSGN
jgi:cytoplasmic iron level regulating protein YaaA (DUF328/UPF0246 family)